MKMITIAEAAVGDIPLIRRVLATTWRATYRSFLSDDAIDQVTSQWHSPEVLRREIDQSSTYVGIARSNEEGVVAMITAHETDRLLFVSRLYVLPSLQRRGIGRLLLDASYAQFPRTRVVRLEVEEQNPHGRAFYRRLGFSEVERKSENVFGSLLQSIVMERDIVRSVGEAGGSGAG